ncbi:MAG: dihydrolipoamide acetyltransferase family protein [Endozoicomonas sp. (ex Botrylloides leachii)]|nr:dihydrolipoamide acetyltransferase family protein [Endozoicomonas sp. (ex Botrylloides leachii)]
MKFFYLPDLGEGIPEADIVKWHVSEGSDVKEDQIIVSVETAKAVVDVPSPVTGVIAKLCGEPGETILTGEPLVEFVSDSDDGTVVGKLTQGHEDNNSEEDFIIGSPPVDDKNYQIGGKLPSADLAALARRYHIDFNKNNRRMSPPSQYTLAQPEPLQGVRKHMARLMTTAHDEVVAVTLFDNADIEHWQGKRDITVSLIQAVIVACQAEPALNAWFDGATMSRQLHDSVHLGIAVDSSDGLFVPVIRSAETLPDKKVRAEIDRLREGVKNRSLPVNELQGATITLSNFGVFAGSYATPIVVPPSVCIIGAGKLCERIVSINKQPESHRILPLSLSFDHRAATGGEASRFLKAIIDYLEN